MFKFRNLIKEYRGSLFLLLCFDALLALAGLFGVFRQAREAALPANLQESRVLAIEGQRTGGPEELTLQMSRYRIGQPVRLRLLDGGEERDVTVRLIGRWSVFPLSLMAALASLCFFGGLMVVLQHPDSPASNAFHWLMAAWALMMLTRPGCQALPPAILNLLLNVVHAVALTAMPLMLWVFTRQYPSTRPSGRKVWLPPGAAAVLLAAGQLVSLQQAVTGQGSEWFRLVRLAGHWWMLALGTLAAVNLIRSWRQTKDTAGRHRLRWFLLGTGPLLPVHLLGRELPPAIGFPPLNPWQFSLLAGLLILISIVLAIRNLQRWYINPVVNRSAVFIIMLALFLAVYTLMLAGIAFLRGDFPLPVAVSAAAGAAVVAALGFGPMRDRVEQWTDRYFLTWRYKLQLASREADGICRQEWEPVRLVDEMAGLLSRSLPVERIQLVLPGGLTCQRLDGDRAAAGVRELQELVADNAMVADPDQIDPEIDCRPVPGLVVQTGLALQLPLVAGGDQPGWLGLGVKTTGQRYLAEEVSFLRNMTAHLTASLDRIGLQRSLVRQQLETDKQQELSRLKSFFIASVSHELQTPLTAIRMFAEMLRDGGRLSRRQTREYLGIIEGESARLSRLIDNVLDTSRIERGEKLYHFQEVDLNELVRSVLRTLRYPLRKEDASVKLKLAEPGPVIRADPDAVAQALTNLIGNALKYSPERKSIRLATRRTGSGIALDVADRGPGITAAEADSVFEPFFRSADPAVRRKSGAGLGLALVRHIMTAHGGRVELAGRPGRGSTFTLIFPEEV